MNYELAKKLKDAGFPQKERGVSPFGIYVPTLSELIEACGEEFFGVKRSKVDGKWSGWVYADSGIDDSHCFGTTPEEAVGNLWLSLNAK